VDSWEARASELKLQVTDLEQANNALTQSKQTLQIEYDNSQASLVKSERLLKNQQMQVDELLVKVDALTEENAKLQVDGNGGDALDSEGTIGIETLCLRLAQAQARVEELKDQIQNFDNPPLFSIAEKKFLTSTFDLLWENLQNKNHEKCKNCRISPDTEPWTLEVCTGHRVEHGMGRLVLDPAVGSMLQDKLGAEWPLTQRGSCCKKCYIDPDTLTMSFCCDEHGKVVDKSIDEDDVSTDDSTDAV
jgi:hypothetical protein